MNTARIERLARKLNNPDLGETILPDGSGVLLDVDGHQVLSLSRTAVFLVKQIRAGTHTPEALAKKLCERFNLETETARRDAQEFLGHLTTALLKEKDTGS